MYRISGKQEFGAVWKNGKCVAVFNNGVATTDDSDVADFLREDGYTVEGESSEDDALTKMSKDELKVYAAEHGVDLSDVPDKKADILAAIQPVGTEQ